MQTVLNQIRTDGGGGGSFIAYSCYGTIQPFHIKTSFYCVLMTGLSLYMSQILNLMHADVTDLSFPGQKYTESHADVTGLSFTDHKY